MLNLLQSIKREVFDMLYIGKLLKSKEYEQDILCARIVKRAHNIEKGLSVAIPRKGFGYDKIIDLLHMLELYVKKGFDTEHPAYCMAIDAIFAYLEYHEQIGFENDDVLAIRKRFSELSPRPRTHSAQKRGGHYGGRLHICKSDFTFPVADIERFFQTRHSVRDFSDKPVDIGLIKKAVEFASRCPSACNRQATRVHILDKADRALLGDWLSGVGGFDKSVDKYIIVTAKLSAYSKSERYQYVVNSSIFAGYLSLTLHLYGIGACLIQRPVIYNRKSQTIAQSLGIPGDERIIMLAGAGMLKEEFYVPVSHRYSSDSIMRIIAED